MNRREFLKLSGMATTGAVALPSAAYAIAIEPTWIEVRHAALPIPNLAPQLSGIRLLQLSDIHRSTQVGAAYIESAIEMAAALDPELIAITGDFITEDPRFFKDIADRLAPLTKRCPSFAVPGNHDYAHWYRSAPPGNPAGGEQLGEQLSRVGVSLLMNRSTQVSLRGVDAAFELVGLDDKWSENYSPEQAFESCLENRTPRLVLAHNPDSFNDIAHQRFDLMLAGHTHGGQVQLPLFGVPYAPCEDTRFISGLSPAEGHLVYTNRGLGWNRRIRFGVRPEITLLSLYPA